MTTTEQRIAECAAQIVGGLSSPRTKLAADDFPWIADQLRALVAAEREAMIKNVARYLVDRFDSPQPVCRTEAEARAALDHALDAQEAPTP